jgi:hypothetical protein
MAAPILGRSQTGAADRDIALADARRGRTNR